MSVENDPFFSPFGDKVHIVCTLVHPFLKWTQSVYSVNPFFIFWFKLNIILSYIIISLDIILIKLFKINTAILYFGRALLDKVTKIC